MSPQDNSLSSSPEARRYQAIRYRLFFFRLFGSIAALLVFLCAGWSRALKVWLLAWREDFFLLAALYISCFLFLSFVAGLPLDIFEGFFLEHRFHLSRQTFGEWSKDLLKKSVVAFIVSLALLESVYFFLSQFPGTWWLWAACFWFFLSIILARIFPYAILPLFFRVRPLEEGEVRRRILALFGRYGVRLKDIFVLDFSRKTVKANAMVAGLGAAKRIFLADTLLGSFSPQEIEVVLAHELGHYLRHDTAKLVVASLASGLFSFGLAYFLFDRFLAVFGFAGPSDVAALPLLLLILFAAGFVLLPLQNGFSRILERQADRFALEATRATEGSPEQRRGATEAFVSMMRKLGEKNLADFSPSRGMEIFFYDHPPIAKRIRMARAFQDAGEHI
ncbi:hypothetical protein BU251_08100 [Candidatus Velamenicoccus archaeovorus]|uniref:Peptidase M48 domain-containing protein n=1 Tax=Velamenicoccus archaeovorus TaxID=1930593 RepID=A0A410P696_VELA1|nr:M48 family metallopeptidase [Candidatus Velamenicoccus archaeovorus]QAT17683.1 hypothetical protein BU251_08100 [Candidatus Velamenicoccus archaeovorus]